MAQLIGYLSEGEQLQGRLSDPDRLVGELSMPVFLGGGLSEEVKQALLDLFQHLAYTDADGQDYYDALYNAFYPPAELTSISAVYTQSGSVFPDTPLDDLKDDLVVTAHYSDSTTEAVPSADYTLSGTLTAGTSTITVTYEDKTTTFNVTVSEPAVLSSITAVYTQSGVVYPTDSLDSLKPDLVVTAHYSDSSTATVTTYTLSGSLTVGTSTITVTYSGKTTTFNVTVTAIILDSITAVYTQSGTVYDTDSLDSLKADLVVTAVYTDSSTEVVPSTDYTLSGTLMAGTSTITVSYEEKTTTFSATVTAGFLYTPDKGILSDQSYINYTVITAQPAYTETITDGLLRMYCPALGSATGRFVYAFDPSTFATSCKLVTEFKIADMSWVASTNVHNGWAKFQLAKQGGTSTAAAAGFARNASTTGVLYLRYEVSNSPTKQEVSLNEWHTLEIECINNKQTIKLDNTVIANAVNSAGYAPSYGVINAYVFDCGNTNANDIYFRKIEFSYE